MSNFYASFPVVSGGGGGVTNPLTSDLDFGDFSAININEIIFSLSGPGNIFTPNNLAGATNSLFLASGDATGGVTGDLNLLTGNSTTNSSGIINIKTGTTDGENNTGVINIITGNPSSIGNSGLVLISSGNTNEGNSGVLNLTTGTGDRTGDVNISSGAAATNLSGDVAITTGVTSGANISSGGIEILTGDSAAGHSGTINIKTGAGLDNVGQARINIVTGSPSSSTGSSGSFQLSSGDIPVDGATGGGSLFTGDASSGTTGISGDLTLFSGDAAGNSGVVQIESGSIQVNGTSGSMRIESGRLYSGATGTTGDLFIGSGLITAGATGNSGSTNITTGVVGGTGSSGSTNITTGNSGSANSGDVSVTSGIASAGNSGNLVLATGSASGTRGKIQLVNGSEGTSGQVWTSIDTVGSGSWQPASGGTTLKYFSGHITAATTSIPNSALTTVIFDATDVDTLSEYNTSTGVLTSVAGGIYTVAANIYWQDGTNTGSRQFYLLKNGSQQEFSAVNAAAYNGVAAPGNTFPGIAVVLAANDTLMFQAFQNDGGAGAVNVIGGVGWSALTIIKIA